MPPDTSFRDFILDQLSPMHELTCQRMFGGFGLYQGESFFAIISAGRLYFLTDPESRNAYVTRGMGPFRPNARQTLTSYYEVPLDILEDVDELSEWAARAVRCRNPGPPELPG